jgi:hypothetical protein
MTLPLALGNSTRHKPLPRSKCETEGFHGNVSPPTRVSSDGWEFHPPQTPPSLETRVFTATMTLPLVFRVTDGNSTNHKPLPHSKRETEGLHGNGNPPTRISSDGGILHFPQTPPSLKTRDGRFSRNGNPPSRNSSDGGKLQPSESLPLAFRVTEGNSTRTTPHKPLPLPKRETEGFRGNSRPPSHNLSDGGKLHPLQTHRSLERETEGLHTTANPFCSRLLSDGGDPLLAFEVMERICAQDKKGMGGGDGPSCLSSMTVCFLKLKTF